jgi:(p)ppGpp synthase/HD superfamily hydrolase
LLEAEGLNPGGPTYERFRRALVVADELHAGQTRKGTDTPYVSHLLGTCSIALEFGADEDEAIAALLHDAIEDTEPPELGRQEVAAFGERVLAIVEACTDTDVRPKPPWHERKMRYIEHLKIADRSALLVSASDKLHNARSIVTDLHRVGPDVFDRFTAGGEGVLWYYPALCDAFRENPAHDPALVDELERVVTEMERLATSAT